MSTSGYLHSSSNKESEEIYYPEERYFFAKTAFKIWKEVGKDVQKELLNHLRVSDPNWRHVFKKHDFLWNCDIDYFLDLWDWDEYNESGKYYQSPGISKAIQTLEIVLTYFFTQSELISLIPVDKCLKWKDFARDALEWHAHEINVGLKNAQQYL